MEGRTGGHPRPMAIIHVAPVPNRRWVVTIGDDPTPISEHETRGEAETAARVHAETFGYPEVVVHGLDDEEDRLLIRDPDPQPRYPGAVRGRSSA